MKPIDLITIITQIETHEQGLNYLDFRIYNNNMPCPKCKTFGKYYVENKRFRRRCKICGNFFSVTKDTLFENSNVPIHKWIIAIYLIYYQEQTNYNITPEKLAIDLGVSLPATKRIFDKINKEIKGNIWLIENILNIHDPINLNLAIHVPIRLQLKLLDEEKKIYKEVAKNILYYIAKESVSIRKLSLYLKITPRQLQKYLDVKNRISGITLLKIANYFDISFVNLFDEKYRCNLS